MFRRLWRIAAPVVAIALLSTVPLARANTVNPGDLGILPDAFGPLAGPVLAVFPGTYTSAPNLAGSFTEYVVGDTQGLDFVYQFTNTGPSVVETITADGYKGFATDVGTTPALTNPPIAISPVGSVSPDTISRSTAVANGGDVVAFHLTLLSGDITSLFVIKTNALYYTANHTSIQDGVATNAVPFTVGPTAVPLPATANMGLALLVFLGGYGAFRQMKLKEECDLA